MKLPESFDDLVSSAARSPGERARRWAAVRRAVASVSPHLVVGGLARLRPRDLRIAFVAIDLHLFHAAYRAYFEGERDTAFAWSVDEDDCGGDAVLEHHPGEEGDVFEFVFDRRRVAKIVDEQLALATTFDGLPARDALDVVLIILARCMLRVVAVVESASLRAIERNHAMLLATLLPVEAATAG